MNAMAFAHFGRMSIETLDCSILFGVFTASREHRNAPKFNIGAFTSNALYEVIILNQLGLEGCAVTPNNVIDANQQNDSLGVQVVHRGFQAVENSPMLDAPHGVSANSAIDHMGFSEETLEWVSMSD